MYWTLQLQLLRNPEFTQLAMDQLNTALSLSMSMSGGTSCCDCYCDCIDDWNTVFPACIAMRTGGLSIQYLERNSGA